jgi:oxygen-independent coproporphyrinogen-3 oxidase
LQFKELEERFSIVFEEYFAEEILLLQPMEDDGLVILDANSITVTATGRLFIRNICMAFDRYIRQAALEKRFSKAI